MAEARLSAAREDSANRLGGKVRSMSKAGPMGVYEWQVIAEDLLDYLAALSAGGSGLDTPEAKAVLRDAAEASIGAVTHTAYFSNTRFSVFLNYVNFGMSHDPYDPDTGGERGSITARDWSEAVCLGVLTGRNTSSHGEAFYFARQAFADQAQGTPPGELATGLYAQVMDGSDDEDADYPLSDQVKLAALDAAIARLRAHAEESGDGRLLAHPDTLALAVLRAVAVEDRAAFDTALAELLHKESTLHGEHAPARSLLPLIPLGLAAHAYRTHGWLPAVDSGYLPHALVTGFEKQGPRVAGLGRDRRPDAVAALAAGPLVVDRPEYDCTVHPETEALFEASVAEALAPKDGGTPSVWRLGSAADDQELLFKRRAAAGVTTDAQLRNLVVASRARAAVFRLALAEPGTEVEVTVDGMTARFPAGRTKEASPGAWQRAVALALITGAREDLAPLVLAGPTVASEDGSAATAYRRALHAYLTGDDPEAAAERALHEREKAEEWGFLPAPAVLLSQLVEGDEESFNLALADALETHRDYYAVGDRVDDTTATVNLDVLALACHARRRGWSIRVESPYLPERILRMAEAIRPTEEVAE
ncbi:Imm49 family immunity protein [Streptomyces sp. NPDC001941]|uniref:immunity 49 family protein n=1 Tax=Streptomyces sp. NPDC001941 TaxID=3154659 RepID=UPI003327E7EE